MHISDLERELLSAVLATGPKLAGCLQSFFWISGRPFTGAQESRGQVETEEGINDSLPSLINPPQL